MLCINIPFLFIYNNIARLIHKNFIKAESNIQKLNISAFEYNLLNEQWNVHSAKMSVRPTAFGLNYIQLVAELGLSMEDVRVEYLILASQMLVLKDKFQ